MELNLTLLIQIINFYIAYKFLDKLLFRPIINEIDKRDATHKQIMHELKEKEAFLAQLQQTKQEQLLAFKKHATDDYIFDEYSLPMLPDQEYQPITGHDIKKTSQSMKKLIVARVCHAH